MVIDSGFRCHLTSYARTTAAAPSAFVIRLRKYLRTRRVTAVSQIGTDRIIELQFSDGQYRLFLEFYAGGNLVLTDKDLTILALLRIVSKGESQEELRVGLKYSLENRQNYGGVPPLTKERVREGLQKVSERTKGEIEEPGKKRKKNSGDALRRALTTTLTEFPPVLLDHALRVKDFESSTPVEDVIKDEALLNRLMGVLEEANSVISGITTSEMTKGYIIAKPVKTRSSVTKSVEGESAEDKGTENLLYEDFHPFKPRQVEDSSESRILEFDGFNKTVDEFFSSIESQKLESRLTEREVHARKKLQAARQEHEKRVGGLQQVQELNVHKAQAIEANLQRVQEAIVAVNGLIGQGMDWMEIAKLIEMEQARKNPVAEMIKLPLKLYENTVTLLLSEAVFEDEDDFDGDETGSDVSDSGDEAAKSSKLAKDAKPLDARLAVDVDLSLSPWSNAREYYDQKKTAAIKEQKTLKSSAIALKNTERKITADLKKGLKQEKEVLRPVRKAFWFEKFYYFISSDGYLVLGGKDAQQNEIIYKRYLKKGDVYVHAELQGAASVIIKNKTGMSDSPIPPSTLSQAGTLVVATSSAWDSKAVMSAWWVNSEQVTKTSSTGEYLTTGAFIIQGKKNFLPPAQLLLGFGIMFQISEESKSRHLKHRINEDKPRFDGAGAEVAKEVADHESSEVEDGGLNQSDQEEGADKEPEESEQHDDGDTTHSDGESDVKHDEDNEDASVYRNPLQSNAIPTMDQDTAASSANKAAGIDGNDNDSSSNEDVEQESIEPTGTNYPNTQIGTPSSSSTRHLSAKAHRLFRAGKSTSQPSTATPSDDDNQSSTSLPPSTNLASATPHSSQANQSQVRGKRGQRTKQKTKYANQDDEDRALALRLLGSAAAQEKKISDESAKAEREAELAAQKERRREQHLRAQQAGKESEEIRRLNMEEGLETLDENEEAEMGLLDAFVGMPLPGDEILDALVVCAPWDAVGARLRWRVKMQPGTVKKGKAVREILGSWGKSIGEREKRAKKDGGEELEKLIKRETDLVRGLRDVEVVGVVPVGKCKVVVSGGTEKARGGGGKAKRGGRGSKKAR